MKRRAPPDSEGPVLLLDDGCLVRIFSFLSPLPDRFNAARVCRRWHGLALDRRMWLRVDSSVPSSQLQRHVFTTIQDAVSAARPGDTILISAGMTHLISNVCVDKPLCLLGAGLSPEDTVLMCPRGCDSGLEFVASSRVANLTVTAELGSCLLHRGGSLIVEGCVLRCGEHPLEHLSCALVSTAEEEVPCCMAVASTATATATSSASSASSTASTASSASSASAKGENGISVIETKIEGGKEAVRTDGGLVLQGVRVIYSRAALVFWFNVARRSRIASIDTPPHPNMLIGGVAS